HVLTGVRGGAAGGGVVDRHGLVVAVDVVARRHRLVDGVAAQGQAVEAGDAGTVGRLGDAVDGEVHPGVRVVARAVGGVLARLGHLDRPELQGVGEGAGDRFVGADVDVG